MKKLIISFLLLLTVTLFFAQTNLAVATFDILGNAVTSDEAEAITELYMVELVSTGKVRVVDRKNFDKILEEMNFQNSDWSDSAKTIEVGKVVNADLLARGQIIKMGSKIYLTTSIIDPNRARVLSSSSEQCNSIDEIFGTLSKLTKSVIEGLSFKIGDIGPGGGTVYKIDGNVYYEYSAILGETTWDDACILCNNYSGGGYNDWYLPTVDDVDDFDPLWLRDGDVSYSENLWTSEESDEDKSMARAYLRQNIHGGPLSWDLNPKPKTNKYKVRAIRCFVF